MLMNEDMPVLLQIPGQSLDERPMKWMTNMGTSTSKQQPRSLTTFMWLICERLSSSNPVKHRRNSILELVCELVILEVRSLKPEPILLCDKGITAWIKARYLGIVVPVIEGYVEGNEVWCNRCLATAHARALATLIHALLVQAHR
ncbi:hypothetical protein U9M48_025968 [Paspalum notatum var. saurae]|uniref:Uncharacterized protein n=1 Tax=Paspalum notatum var. saurae TaxID=547442 RepID=A0AAQ3TTP7_PASNO